ncbi:ligand-binding sensor domain-containing protein [Mucilaginibacter sp. FT3.2]|uniref:ligand-binding sensor domain-containing protein n=1 Tax=Mucilaginibacter sp. FT3.2 TaxID=2723090 RepID=UPI0016230983|nr:two-component regulator propeller domain-containing protein [Mucilaginibacter sp. FT3.2]MBB6233168.1 ligand-binding sensor domain-containing protein [Mucilaginibacter sp. FT3.2]
MKNKGNVLYSLIIILAGVINFPVQAQQKNGAIKSETKDISTSHGPTTSVRTIRQDSKGNMLLVSIEGIIRYDGKSFTNLTSKMGSHKFWDVLEDRRGNFWFASLGSGVFYYDGKSFQNFTTRDGLASNLVFEIYEDKAGIIWFGTGEGASRYDGKSFRNFKMKEGPPPAYAAADSVHVSDYHKELHHPEVYWMINETNNRIHTIIEDKTGKFWFGTWGDVCIYDGKTYTSLTNKYGRTFKNVRSMVKDRKGNIWLGGGGGLWRYDGTAFTNFTRNSVDYVYNDRKGNIWTSSRINNGQDWALSRYDQKSLSDKKPTVTEIKSGGDGVFGISEARDGSIWFGATDGVYRYDGKIVKRL